MHHTFGNFGAAAVSFFQFAFAFGGYVLISRQGSSLLLQHVRLQRDHIGFHFAQMDHQPDILLFTGDTIPHVIAYIFPALSQHAVLRLLVDRRTVILLCTIGISFPLSLHRDIVKLSKSSSFGMR